MCAPGVCADGYALFAVFRFACGKKFVRLRATSVAEAYEEAKQHVVLYGELLYVESQRV